MKEAVGKKFSIKRDLVTKSRYVSENEAWTLLMVSVAVKAFEDFVSVMQFLDDDTGEASGDPETRCFDGTREGAMKVATDILRYADSGIFPLADGAGLFRRYYLRHKLQGV